MKRSILPPPPPRRAARRFIGGTRPLQTWIWVGGVSAVLGVLAVAGWVGVHLVKMSDEVDALNRSRPGSASMFVVDEPVEWTVFVEPSDASLSGIRIRIWDVEAGREAPMKPYGRSFSYGFPSHTGRAFATISLDPGTYSMQVEGSGVNLAVGPSPAGHLVWILVGGLALGVPFVIGGLALVIVAALRESKRRNRLAAMPPPPTWSTGEWRDGGR